MESYIKQKLTRLDWIARLTPANCPGGLPTTDRAWRDLVNRMVKDVRKVLSDLSDASDKSDKSDRSDESEPLDPYETGKANAEVAANTLICLINQAIYLLKKQLEALERAFLDEGGFTERIYRKRQEQRQRQRLS